MFRLIFKMFIGFLSTCTFESFDGSLAPNSKGDIKCVSLRINHVKIDQHVLI